ncbi:MAG: hypothetical protein O3B84_05290, partial [Chloroflexi bacterium]|nr:hypothetical protein [Chloroflexota bacterium]
MEAQDGARLLMEVAWFTMAGTLATVLIGAQTTLVPLWLGVPVGISGYGLRRFFVPQSAPPATARLFTVGTGVAVLYVAIALLPGIDLDFAWPLRFSEDWQASRHVVVGGLLIIVLWLRGTALGQEEGSAISLSQSFRIGVSVIVVGTVAHIALPFDLGATPATYLFFGAGIAGFALAHIASMAPQESAGLRDWPRTAAITVAAIVIGSILLAVIAEGKAGEGAAFVVRMVARVITPIVILIAWAIAIVVEGLTYLFLLVASSVRGGSEPVFFTPTMPDFSNVEPGA